MKMKLWGIQFRWPITWVPEKPEPKSQEFDVYLMVPRQVTRVLANDAGEAVDLVLNQTDASDLPPIYNFHVRRAKDNEIESQLPAQEVK